MTQSNQVTESPARSAELDAALTAVVNAAHRTLRPNGEEIASLAKTCDDALAAIFAGFSADERAGARLAVIETSSLFLRILLALTFRVQDAVALAALAPPR